MRQRVANLIRFASCANRIDIETVLKGLAKRCTLPVKNALKIKYNKRVLTMFFSARVKTTLIHRIEVLVLNATCSKHFRTFFAMSSNNNE